MHFGWSEGLLAVLLMNSEASDCLVLDASRSTRPVYIDDKQEMASDNETRRGKSIL